jgi:DNA recombination protein RmuC
MSEPTLYLLLLLLLAAIVLLTLLLKRSSRDPLATTAARFDAIERNQERSERLFRDEMAKNREENKQDRQELNDSFRTFNESVLRRLAESAAAQKDQLDIFSSQLKTLTDHNVQKLDKINETVEKKLASIQEDNNKKLEQMRATVDEKLHDTLEKRLGESFKLVSDRLEQVHKGLGEMQSLAVGVGDLKKVLTNVKTRGTYGEIQLGSLLEQLLTRDQYDANVATKKGSNARVEFAIRLPGRDEATNQCVWLPIDAKFPQEDYLRLVEAQEQGNPAAVEDSSRQLERAVKEMAKLIRDKYLDPPGTTDFGIMFLPTEGLYAEVLRRPGLFEILQREFKVILTGPTTLAALLNSLQMGFKTLAVEKRSSEVWSLLGAVKTEFANFGTILDRTKKKLQEASNTIDSAATRTRVIERKLRTVQELPAADAVMLLEEGEERLPEEEMTD